MAFSGEVWTLNKIADLARNCGVSPTVANFDLRLNFRDDDSYYYSLSYIDGNARNKKEREAIDKVIKLLGFESSVVLEFPDLMAVEEAVDHALSLAPRARVR